MAVLIQKAMLEIPPRFAGRPPVHPDLDRELTTWSGAQGLAADVKAYGEWMRDEAKRRIGHLYPDAIGPDGEKLTPIAWIWARTVKSPDPAWRGHVPLVVSWVLSNKKGKPRVWIEPIIDREQQTISYAIREGGEPVYERTVTRGNGVCIATGAAIPGTYIKSESRAGRLGNQLMTVVARGTNGRIYLPPQGKVDPGQPAWKPKGRNPKKLTGGTVYVYGLDRWWKLFTTRQLVALTTLSDLTKEAWNRVVKDAEVALNDRDTVRLCDGGSGAEAYADAVVTYLALGVSRLTDMCNAFCRWESSRTQVRNLFTRQAIPMIWHYAENNIFSDAGGDFRTSLRSILQALQRLPVAGTSEVGQQDARSSVRVRSRIVVSTDPPYYDNVSYADLSDFFYVWLRRSLSDVWPYECATLLTPKVDELIANRFRAGSKQAANDHFESGMTEFMSEVASRQTIAIPATIYYAYKATESRNGEVRATGWATFLQAVVDAGMQVTATWPMRTELANRMLARGTNALASSIVLACRPRSPSAPLSTRGQFLTVLRSELPEAVRKLQSGNIAPVDLPQSTIGPGIRVFSRYAKVIEADGSAMPVSDALAIINDVLGEILDGAETELDPETRFAVTWYAQHGFDPASSGDADNMARAKNTSLSGIETSGIGQARGGSFRLRGRDELDPDWNPQADDRLTVWAATQHLVAALGRSEPEAAALLQRLGAYGDRARELAYVLFNKATEARRADEATAYNGLINTWTILRSMPPDPQQALL